MKNTLYIILLLLIQISVLAQPELLDGFSHEWLDLEFENPVGLGFDEMERMYVWEKSGKVWLVNNEEQPTIPLLDISEEVGNYGDMGMLGFVMDPNYLENGFIYAFYLVDYYYLMFSDSPLYDPTKDLYDRATVSRVTRYTVQNVANNPIVDYDSRKVLLGQGPGLGPSALHLSHTGCALAFGDDGTLLLATGDGAGWEGPYYGDGPPYFSNYVAGALTDGIISEKQEVGSLSSQQKDNLNGKVLRIDPSTGEGIPSNPFFDASDPSSPKSKIWALGFRNPFKLIIRPGSGFSDPALGLPGVIYVGDVGDGLWEELNIIRTPGENFGWPLYEGCDENVNFPHDRINQFAPNPLYQTNGCETEFFEFEDLLKQSSRNEVEFKNPCNENVAIPEELTFVHSRPALNLAHSTAGYGVYFGGYDENGVAENLPIDHPTSPIDGNDEMGDLRARCIIGGDFYNGGSFPDEYQGKYFFADYNVGWINYIDVNLNDSITAVKPFFKDTFPKVDLAIHPTDGCLYIINYTYGMSRVCYGDNLAPRASIKADVNYGSSPLTVNFDASESLDPQGEAITYEWEFGDGGSSIDQNPSHTFVAQNSLPESFNVKLTVTDEDGQRDIEQELISLNNSPPVVKITSVQDGQLYDMTGISEVDLAADVIDAEHEDGDLSYRWIWSLHHNTHNHPEPVIESHTGTINLNPTGCEEEVYYYGLSLSVEDPEGLVGKDVVYLYPDCDSKYLELLSFKVKLNNGVTECDWIVLEENVSHYEVERSRVGGAFISLGREDAVNIGGEESYQMLDPDVLPGINVYRLKMVSNDGAITYSQNEIVLLAEENDIFLYPNPVVDELQIFYGRVKNFATVEVFNIEGKLVRRFELVGNGTQIQKVNLIGVNPGNYVYRITNGETIKTGSFIIAN